MFVTDHANHFPAQGLSGVFHASVNNWELKPLHTCASVCVGQISWYEFSRIKAFGYIKFRGVAQFPHMETVPMSLSCVETTVFLPGTHTCVNKSLHLCSSYGGKWCFSLVLFIFLLFWMNSDCFGRPLCFFFYCTQLSVNFLCSSLNWAVGFFLSLLYSGCCWKISFCLASFTQPVGVFWSLAVKQELCLRTVKPTFQHHWSNAGLVTVHFIKSLSDPAGGLAEIHTSNIFTFVRMWSNFSILTGCFNVI
jgi:hypothetical protein